MYSRPATSRTGGAARLMTPEQYSDAVGEWWVGAWVNMGLSAAGSLQARDLQQQVSQTHSATNAADTKIAQPFPVLCLVGCATAM
jgi:hypothetical protein